jgi:hypothetical protein
LSGPITKAPGFAGGYLLINLNTAKALGLDVLLASLNLACWDQVASTDPSYGVVKT